MQRWYTCIGILTCSIGLSVSSPTAARFGKPDDSVYPRVVAKVTVLAPRGLATIQTADGATYEVVAGTEWRVGDTVSCERSDREGGKPLWKAFDCRKE
jgi:hypothetical protein